MTPNKERLDDFAERLAECRKARGMSIDDVAQSLGTTRATIGHWETGIREPSLAALVKLAALLRVSTDRMLGAKKK